MSSIAHLYDDFGNRLSPSGEVPSSEAEESETDEVRLASYEDGYKAGWDDAAKAINKEDMRLTEEFLHQLQDMSFTYHEACNKISAAVKPLLLGMVTRLLPEMMIPALEAQLADQLGRLVDQQLDGTVELAVAPVNVQRVKILLRNRIKPPFVVTAEPALANGQVFLRIAGTEREINLDDVLGGITEAISAFLHSTKPENEDG